MNDPSIDDEDMNSSDNEQNCKDKKRRKKNTTINIDSLQYSSSDENQPQSPYSPDQIRQEDKDNEEDF
jgi:hypothetical protein